MKLDAKTVCELTKPLDVLYAEDDLNLRMETEIFLKHFFDDITLADDGEDALKQYQEHKFDLIISDINMPNMNGIDMAKAIKELDNDQPFIFISAHDDSSHLMKLMQMGITKFIAKPFKSNELLQVLYDTAKEIISRREEHEFINTLVSENTKLLEKTAKVFEHPKEETKSDASSNNRFELKAESTSLKSSILRKNSGNDDIDHDHHLEIDISELDDIFDRMDSLIAMKCLHPEETFSIDETKALATYFRRYASQLALYEIFKRISSKIVELSHAISDVPIPEDKDAQQYIFVLIESLLKTLKSWQDTLETSDDLNFFDDSISSDVDVVIAAWENKQEDLEGDIDFF